MIWTLDELSQLLGVPRQHIVDAHRRLNERLLSWTKMHGGYCCHESTVHELKRALGR
jgi:hypothetical protein